MQRNIKAELYITKKLRLTDQEKSRFFKYVNVLGEGECWIWTGYKSKYGYGTFHLAGRSHSAHRISFAIEYGYLPEGREIHHLCGNPSCMNPGHLGVLSSYLNKRASNSPCARNARKSLCKHGHPLDKRWGGYRYCSTCDKLKKQKKRERKKN